MKNLSVRSWAIIIAVVITVAVIVASVAFQHGLFGRGTTDVAGLNNNPSGGTGSYNGGAGIVENPGNSENLNSPEDYSTNQPYEALNGEPLLPPIGNTPGENDTGNQSNPSYSTGDGISRPPANIGTGQTGALVQGNTPQSPEHTLIVDEDKYYGYITELPSENNEENADQTEDINENGEDVPPNFPQGGNLIINHLFAGGSTGSNAVSHSFVEIYNTSANHVYIGGYSVQIQTPGDPGSGGYAPAPPIPWDIIPLFGYIAPRSSFLIVSTFGESTAEEYLVIENWDIAVEYEFGNRGLSIALVSDQNPLPAFITGGAGSRVIDLVGAINTGPPRDRSDNYFVSPTRVTRSQGARRMYFIDTRNNEDDFYTVRYLDLTDAEWAQIRPRYSGDGEWIMEPAGEHEITVKVTGGFDEDDIRARVRPNPAEAGQTITLEARTLPPGHRFTGWTTETPGVTIENAHTPRDAEFEMIDAPVTVTANFIQRDLPELIINQIHGQGSPGTNAVSHGFIELYNPTNSPINLNGISVQIASGSGIRQWAVLELPDFTMSPRTSFLIVSTDWFNDNSVRPHVPDDARGHRVRYVIRNWDLEWNTRFNNNNLVVALVEGAERLSDRIAIEEWERVIDLVGAHNDSPENTRHYLGEGPAGDISRQASVRRVNFRNTQNNRRDFIRVHFAYPNNYRAAAPGVATNSSGITNDELELFRPRYSGDGPWRIIMPTTRFVNIRDGNRGYHAYPNPARFGDEVTLNSGVPPMGQMFSHWTSETEGVYIHGELSPRWATITMPSIPVNVRAHFFTPVLPPPSVIINQVHGQGEPGANAISHGFIELYNPTDLPKNLGGLSLQIASGPNIRPWQVLELPNFMMPPKTSFLIVSTAWYNVNTTPSWGIAPVGHVPRLILTEWDLEWDVQFDNTNLVAALVDGTAPLSSLITPDEWGAVVDIVGAHNNAEVDTLHFVGAGPAGNFSRQASVRRIEAQNTRNNMVDLERIDFRYPYNYAGARNGPAQSEYGITNVELARFRPRHAEYGEWTPIIPRFDVIVVGGGAGYSVTPESPVPVGATVMLNAGASPLRHRFVRWVSQEAEIMNPTRQVGATFEMPEENVTVTAEWAEIPEGLDFVLMELVREESNAAEDSGGRFNATGGIFQGSSHLSAFGGGVRLTIGYMGTSRAPMVLNNFNNPGWRSVNQAVDSDHLDYGITVDTATAFEIRFETTGYQNIRFSARQRSTGSGPDFFALAYRVGSSGGFSSIPETRNIVSLQNTQGFRDNAYSDLNWAHSQTFNQFTLPEATTNQEVVYLRVYMRESGIESSDSARTTGNTSINDIFIIGDTLGTVRQTFTTTIIDGGEGYSATPERAERGTIITLDVGETPRGRRFVNWTSEDVVINMPGLQSGATFEMPDSNVTVTANWLEIPIGTDIVLMSMSRMESDVVMSDYGNQINATGGLFRNVSNLRAFSDNSQVPIGSLNAGNPLAPVAFRNQSNVGGRGWRGVGTMAEDEDITVDTASAWQIRFSAEGHENIRFSAQQRSTGSGPDGFALAYRVGSFGSFTPIVGSERRVYLGGEGGPAVFGREGTHSFVDFLLPEAVNNEDIVYLRVYAYGLTITNRPNGNTSINNIVIVGDEMPDMGDIVRYESPLLINQIYGQGTPGVNAVSHGFVEIYNPSDEVIYLGNYSVQVQIVGDGNAVNNINPGDWNWVAIPLTGRTIYPRHSLLIVSETWENTDARYDIPAWDITTNVQFSNRNMSVAIVNGHMPLANIITMRQTANVIDLVGVTNELGGTRDVVHNYWGHYPALRISRSEAARRIWDGNTPRNTENNHSDFAPVRYVSPYDSEAPGISHEELEQLRPRYSGDGAWPEVAQPSETITFEPEYAEINDHNLGQTIHVTGTAIGEITISIAALPANIHAVTSGAAIVITGSPVAANVSGTFNIQVTRENVTRPLPVHVNLTGTAPLSEVETMGTNSQSATEPKCEHEYETAEVETDSGAESKLPIKGSGTAIDRESAVQAKQEITRRRSVQDGE